MTTPSEETADLGDISTVALIAELQRRREEIDRALESRHQWETREHPILSAAANQWGQSAARLFEKTRALRVCEPRQAAMVLFRQAGFTIQQIADIFSMDPATVVYACRTHAGRMTNERYRDRFLAAAVILDTL